MLEVKIAYISMSKNIWFCYPKTKLDVVIQNYELESSIKVG